MADKPFDAFGDVINAETGIFSGSSGLKAYDGVKAEYTPEGLRVEAHCPGCGFPRHVEISWPELIALKYDLSPYDAFNPVPSLRQFASPWSNTAQVAHRGVDYAWYPVGLRCRCGQDFKRPLISPGECEGHLVHMRRNRWMPPQAEQQLSQHCSQTRSRMG